MHDTQLDELLSSFFQCQIWKILVCGAQICDIVRWSDEESDEMKLMICTICNLRSTGEICPRNGGD